MDHEAVLITWTTYGTWMPGDSRGWRHRDDGRKIPKPLLEQWARQQMKGESVLLTEHDRRTVENACREHCEFRGWNLLAINARSNHVHVVVAANESPQKIRDQLKANSTRALRNQPKPLHVERTWTRGGDCELLDTPDDVESAVLYVTVAQDRKDRDEM